MEHNVRELYPISVCGSGRSLDVNAEQLVVKVKAVALEGQLIPELVDKTLLVTDFTVPTSTSGQFPPTVTISIAPLGRRGTRSLASLGIPAELVGRPGTRHVIRHVPRYPRGPFNTGHASLGSLSSNF